MKTSETTNELSKALAAAQGEMMTKAQQDRALCILHEMALERTGWRSWFKRWSVSDEPLRNDAANLIREIGYWQMRPANSRILGSEPQTTEAA